VARREYRHSKDKPEPNATSDVLEVRTDFAQKIGELSAHWNVPVEPPWQKAEQTLRHQHLLPPIPKGQSESAALLSNQPPADHEED
jgi:hypothetical protein